MKIYISGKISGMEARAAVLFQEAETMLIEHGYEVVNPIKLPHKHDKSWASYMKEDLRALIDCDGIYYLENHAQSPGAALERYVAQWLNIDEVFLPPF